MDQVAFLHELVSIPSPSGEEEAVGEFLVEQMAALGFDARLDEVGNAIGVAGDAGAEREIVLMGHMDTVPGEVPIEIRDNRLYGRGSVDAKGPLATFVLAAANVAPRLNGCRLVVIGSVEEERHGAGARHVARTRQSPECAIIGEPNHWDCVALGYKGLLSLTYRWEQAGMHDTGDQVGPAQKAVTFWNDLVTYADAQNGGESGRFSTLDPALREFLTAREGLNESVRMNIAVRLPPAFDHEGLMERMRGWTDGAELEFAPVDPPYRSEKNTPLVRAMLRAIRKKGGRPRFRLKTGTADINVVGPAWGCPMVVYGPGDSHLDHTPDEHIELDEYKRSIAVLTLALEHLTGCDRAHPPQP